MPAPPPAEAHDPRDPRTARVIAYLARRGATSGPLTEPPGTQYALRLPGPLLDEALAAGASTCTRWSGGGDFDTRRDLGDDWVLGAWLEAELAWCRRAYAALEEES